MGIGVFHIYNFLIYLLDRLYGSNSACTNPSLYPEEANFPTTPFPELCRFDGITGELPPEFGKLEGIIYL